MNLKRKKIALGLFTAAGSLLVKASVAFACVTLVGSLTVAPPSPRRTGATVFGDNLNSMVYCSAITGSTAPATANKGDSITYTVDGSTCAGTSTSGQLTQGTNNVYVNNSTTGFTYDSGTNTWSFTNGQGCFASPAPAGNTLQGTISVDANGHGVSLPLPLLLPASPTVNGANDASVACVGGGASSGIGIFAPLQVLTIV